MDLGQIVYKNSRITIFMGIIYLRNSIILSLGTILFCLNAYSINLVFADEHEEENYSMLTKLGSKGTGNGQFTTPHTIAFDSAGNMYITDTKNSNVQKFDSNGTFLTKWGSKGVGQGQFLELEDIEIDSSDKVYLVDRGAASILIFTKLE